MLKYIAWYKKIISMYIAKFWGFFLSIATARFLLAFIFTNQSCQMGIPDEGFGAQRNIFK